MKQFIHRGAPGKGSVRKARTAGRPLGPCPVAKRGSQKCNKESTGRGVGLTRGGVGRGATRAGYGAGGRPSASVDEALEDDAEDR